MSEAQDTSPWRSGDAAPATEADRLAGEDIWVTARHAADVVGRTERWVDEQCRAGRLPCHRKQENGEVTVLVPMAATRELAAQASS